VEKSARVAALDYLGTVASRLRQNAIGVSVDQNEVDSIISLVLPMFSMWLALHSHAVVPLGAQATFHICFCHLTQAWKVVGYRQLMYKFLSCYWACHFHPVWYDDKLLKSRVQEIQVQRTVDDRSIEISASVSYWGINVFLFNYFCWFICLFVSLLSLTYECTILRAHHGFTVPCHISPDWWSARYDKVKVQDAYSLDGCRLGAHLLSLGHWDCRWINHLNLWHMASMMPDQTYCYLSRRLTGTSASVSFYQWIWRYINFYLYCICTNLHCLVTEAHMCKQLSVRSLAESGVEPTTFES